MLSAEQIYQSIENIVKAKGTNDTKMLANAGLKKNVMTNIKNGSMPSIDKIAAIADVLDVSIDDLIGRNKKSAPDNSSRNALIEKVIQMPDAKASILLALLESPEE